jgi:hypothetical protein
MGITIKELVEKIGGNRGMPPEVRRRCARLPKKPFPAREGNSHHRRDDLLQNRSFVLYLLRRRGESRVEHEKVYLMLPRQLPQEIVTPLPIASLRRIRNEMGKPQNSHWVAALNKSFA